MRISDWSSDVCSSDLVLDQPRPPWRSRGLIEVPFDPDTHLMHPWFTRTQTIEYPSLIDQLELAVAGGTAGVSSSGYGSRPAVSVPAVDALGTMHREAIIWLRSGFRVQVSSDTATNLRAIAGRDRAAERREGKEGVSEGKT